MSRWYRANLAAMGCVAAGLLFGCQQPRPAITAAEAAYQLRDGGALLTCRQACLAEWQQNQPLAAQLAAGRRWPDLAALLLRIGYQDDLSLYYLGQAAEGLGYPAAAASYYRQSTYVTGSAISCRNLSGLCGGLAFPRAAAERLAAIDYALQPRPRRFAPAPREREVPHPAETPRLPEAQPVSAWENPGPVAAEPAPAAAPPAPAAGPVSPVRPARPSSSDFIEPPPAR